MQIGNKVLQENNITSFRIPKIFKHRIQNNKDYLEMERIHFPFNNTEIEVFNKLNKYFKIIHFHANNCCGTRNHNGVIIPNVFECTYLNLKFFNNYYELNTEVIPGVLDMKNVLENNEIIINYEPFVNNLNFKTNFLI